MTNNCIICWCLITAKNQNNYSRETRKLTSSKEISDPPVWLGKWKKALRLNLTSAGKFITLLIHHQTNGCQIQTYCGSTVWLFMVKPGGCCLEVVRLSLISSEGEETLQVSHSEVGIMQSLSPLTEPELLNRVLYSQLWRTHLHYTP